MLANEILAEAGARPYLSRHDEWDWHLHVTRPEAPLANRIGAEAAMAFLDLIRSDALGRLRICAAQDCEDVVIDLSKNSSKRYCDTGKLRQPDQRRGVPSAQAPGERMKAAL